MPPAEFEVRVTPRASRTRIEPGQPVRVWVTAAPTDGQANQALVEALADALGVPKSRVEIVSGHSGRTKRVRVEGLGPEDVLARLG